MEDLLWAIGHSILTLIVFVVIPIWIDKNKAKSKKRGLRSKTFKL